MPARPNRRTQSDVPEDDHGFHTTEPQIGIMATTSSNHIGLQGALNILLIMGSSPLQMQEHYPTRDQADADLSEFIVSRMRSDRCERPSLRCRLVAKLRSVGQARCRSPLR